MCIDYTDLNKACPKDPYPLPSIDRLVDGVSGYALLSFMDAYSGYNQIRMHHEDEEKTAFIIDAGAFYYKVMPFGLKYAGATYQRLMDKIFKDIMGDNIEVYVDDMVVKSTKAERHCEALGRVFGILRTHQLKLNPEKCSFGVHAGKFLGFMLTERGIEANPEKCQAVIGMRSPQNIREVQQLIERITALSRFISKSAETAKPIFGTLKKAENFIWTQECEEAFLRFKAMLASPPVLTRSTEGIPLELYISVSDTTVSAVLIQEREGTQRPVYFFSKVLQGAELRYQKIEKAALAMVVASRRLRPYFQNFGVIVKTDLPIRQVLKKPNLAGRMVAWSVQLSKFEIAFERRGHIKAQALVDFLTELILEDADGGPDETKAGEWYLSVDGSSNHSRSGAGVILEGPAGVIIEQSLHFEFKASNNQAEYEALLAGMRLVQELEVKKLTTKSDSKLVTGQVNGEYQTRDPQLVKYWEKAKKMASTFESFILVHVPRDHNERADLLAKLASTQRGQQKSVIHENLQSPMVGQAEVGCVEEKNTWATPILRYIQDNEIPHDVKEARRITREASKYVVVGHRLYRRGFASPLLRCIGENETEYVIREVHEGICGTHIGGRALANKIIRAGYYWPTMRNDCMNFVKKCDKCQRFAEGHKAPPERLHSIMAPWPFHKWGIDILGPFPIASGQLKFLIVAVDYFTKWVEAEPVATISAERIKRFLWKKIVCRFGILAEVVSDNGTQFASKATAEFCEGLKIKQLFTSVEHPQSNGQAEAANKVKKPKEDGQMNWLRYYVIPVEIGEPSPRITFSEQSRNEEELRANLDLLQEVREIAHIKEYAVKARVAKKYNERLIPCRFNIADLVLRKITRKGEGNKLSPLWEGPFRVIEEVGRGAYCLE
ncbi:Retrovirus-related Pol polyprotein from transposon 17.6, partial [Mucuna pruriens]